MHVELQAVDKCFDGTHGQTVEALAGIDLAVGRGEFVSVLGPSGCGKSTLLAMVAGITAPSAGRLLVEGEPLDGPDGTAGIVFQNDLLLEWRTVLDNLLLPFQLRGERARAHLEDARELLRMVDLERFAESRPWQLSGGMRQRAAICRALVSDPPLLLMDEPFGSLDALTREQLNVELSRITAEAGKTVLFVTHSIEEAVFLGDRVVVMSPRPGRIVSDVAVPLQRPRRQWPRGESEFDPYVSAARSALVAEEV